MGFFSRAELPMAQPSSEGRVAQCGLCGLSKTCVTPKMPVWGLGGRGLMVIGEAPGREEDDRGVPFVGQSGQRLLKATRAAGIDLKRDCWVTNALICRPPGNKIPGDRNVDYCRPNVLAAIREYKPRAVLLLGGTAVQSVLSYAWKPGPGGITKWAGFRAPSQKTNAWLCPTYHPSFIIRSKESRGGAATEDPVLGMHFDTHVKAWADLDESPWPGGVPDYASHVRIEMDPDRAAKLLRTVKGGVVAFDYETTTLKPDGPHAEIVSCSVCHDGEWTVAYPWLGAAAQATREILSNPKVRKVASNIKFEDRWSRRVAKVSVKNWAWDTMLAAHALDSRGEVTGIKFQSFVHLGQPDYDSHVKGFLKSRVPGGNSKNQIRKLDWKSLLLYNGLDSLLEYLVAKSQADQMGLSLEG